MELYDVTTTTCDPGLNTLVFNFKLIGEDPEEAKELAEFAACEALRVIWVAKKLRTAAEMSLFIDEQITFEHSVKLSKGY